METIAGIIFLILLIILFREWIIRTDVIIKNHIIFILLLTSIGTYGQTKYLEDTDTVEGTGKANGGEYGYEATVKCRANAPGLGDVRLQCSILSFKITSFKHKDNYYYRSEEGFPIVIDKVQSNLDGIFKFTQGVHYTEWFEHEILGVRKGAFDIKYLTDEEVKGMVDRFQMKTSKDFYDLSFDFILKSLTNTYFEELSNFKNGILKKNAASKSENDEWMAQQKQKAQDEIKRIEAIGRAEAKEREEEQKQQAYDNQFKSQAQLQEEENIRLTNSTMNSINASFNEIGIANKKRKDARLKEEAKERELERKARWKKEDEELEETLRQIKIESAGSFSEGLAPSVSRSDGHLKYGYINSKGYEIIPSKFDHADSFSESLARVEIEKKWGYINNLGEFVIPTKYDWALDFSNGIAMVELNGKSGLIDKSGNIIVSIKYDELGSFSEGLIFAKLNGLYGYINKMNEVVIPFIYMEVTDFSNGKAKVVLDGMETFIDESGELLKPIKFSSEGDYSEGLAVVTTGRESYGEDVSYGFIDKSGNLFIPLKYQSAKSFKEGLSAVKINGKWGFIDKFESTIIAFKYDYVASFKNGRARVRMGYLGSRTWGMIDKNHNFIIPMKYEYLGYLEEGLIVARLNDKYGYIDINNRVVIPFIYDNANSFSNGIAKVVIEEDFLTNTSYINKSGRCVKGCD